MAECRINQPPDPTVGTHRPTRPAQLGDRPADQCNECHWRRGAPTGTNLCDPPKDGADGCHRVTGVTESPHGCPSATQIIIEPSCNLQRTSRARALALSARMSERRKKQFFSKLFAGKNLEESASAQSTLRSRLRIFERADVDFRSRALMEAQGTEAGG